MPSDKTDEPTTVETEIKASVDGKGTGEATLPSDIVEAAIKKATEHANKIGTTKNGIAVVINISTGGKMANAMLVNLKKTTQETMIRSGVLQLTIAMKNPALSIGLNLSAVTEIHKQANGDVQLAAKKIPNTAGMSEAAKETIGIRPIFALTVTYQNGTKTVSDVGDGKITVAIGYAPPQGENVPGLHGVYADKSSQASKVTQPGYDANRKAVTGTDSHFGTYAVGYQADVFTDITDHWAKVDIGYVANFGLLFGTGGSTFTPNGSMTRGMFVTALGRLTGIDSTKHSNTPFTDVKSDAYCTPYVAGAAENHIVSGTTATTFAPNQVITRQEMALIMYNYAKAMGYALPKTREPMVLQIGTRWQFGR